MRVWLALLLGRPLPRRCLWLRTVPRLPLVVVVVLLLLLVLPVAAVAARVPLQANLLLRPPSPQLLVLLLVLELPLMGPLLLPLLPLPLLPGPCSASAAAVAEPRTGRHPA